MRDQDLKGEGLPAAVCGIPSNYSTFASAVSKVFNKNKTNTEVVETVIEKRKPLSDSARRAGWVGCNILLNEIPPEGIIKIIEDSRLIERSTILNRWKKISFIKETPLPERGWTIDVLRVVHSLGKKEFALKEIYGYKEEFAKSHPNNTHIRAKIRQQLQILRDRGILKFKERGKYLVLR